MKSELKSTLPSSSPIGGMMRSLTSEVEIFPNDAPMTIPIAISTTFPLTAKSRNFCSMVGMIKAFLFSVGDGGALHPPLRFGSRRGLDLIDQLLELAIFLAQLIHLAAQTIPFLDATASREN